MVNETHKTWLGVAIIVVVIAAIVLAVLYINPPSRQVIQVVEKENNTVQTVYVTVTPVPVPMRTPVPTKVPTPKPRMPFGSSQIKSIFEIDFDRALSGISAEERGLILGRENQQWQSVAQKEIVYNAIANYQREKRNEVSSIEGSFDKFLYTQDGMAYLAENVSVPSGTANVLRQKKVAMSVGSFYNSQQGRRDSFVNFYKNGNVVIGTGIGGDLKVVTIYLPGSDSGDGSGADSVSGSGNSDTGGGSGGGGSADTGSAVGGVGAMIYPLYQYLFSY